MKDEKGIRLDIQRGMKAKQILEEPLIIEFFEQGREALIQKLEESEIDKERQEEIVRMVKVFAQFKRNFEQHIKQGKKSESLLERLKKQIKGNA